MVDFEMLGMDFNRFYTPQDAGGNVYSSTKSYFNYSCAHRQWRHGGHCAFVHGYDRSFHFWFAARELTDTNFVMDFGKLKDLKAFLDEHFDHTLLLNADDPLMDDFKALAKKGAAKIVVLPNVGMEGTSKWLWDHVNNWLLETEGGRVGCIKVETREHEKNSAYYKGFPVWFPCKEAK
jgi:6-pyruvoyltetrahydropterin/6-carboxytetrahydropterin synthase